MRVCIRTCARARVCCARARQLPLRPNFQTELCQRCTPKRVRPACQSHTCIAQLISSHSDRDLLFQYSLASVLLLLLVVVVMIMLLVVVFFFFDG